MALSAISVGYSRDFVNSNLGNFYGLDRGYMRFDYFFGGRALVALTGGLGAVEYPKMVWGDDSPRLVRPSGGGGGSSRAFTDLRADATLFGEYRLADSFGINATLRYSANFSDNQVEEQEKTNAFFDMSWTRFEAFAGVRWFL